MSAFSKIKNSHLFYGFLMLWVAYRSFGMPPEAVQKKANPPHQGIHSKKNNSTHVEAPKQEHVLAFQIRSLFENY